VLIAWLRRNWMPVAGIAAFCVLACLVYGGNPMSSSALPQCACGDEAQEVWFLAWPAFALSHGLNPLYSQYVAFPKGIDLMSSTSMPLLGVLMSPVTLAAGPVVAYNLLARLALASSATSMTLVLRRYVGAWPAALAGGLLYGFSPFFIAEGVSHLYLTFSLLPPLIFMLLDELLVRRRWHPLRTGLLLGLVVALQLLVAVEVLAITGLMAGAVLVLMLLRHPVAARERARELLVGLGAALGTFAVLAAYPIWEFAAGPQHVSGRQHPASVYISFHDDLLSTVIPTSQQLLGSSSLQTHGNLLAQGNGVDHAIYLGIPLIVLLVYLGVRFRRIGVLAIGALVSLAGLVLTLGARLFVDGTLRLSPVRLPYDIVLHLPELNGILATRFALGTYFGAALVLAVGLDRLGRQGLGLGRLRRGAGAPAGAGDEQPAGGEGLRRSLACAVVAGVALLPLVPRIPYGSTQLPVPTFFDRPALLARIPVGSVVLTYPDAQVPTLDGPASPEVRSMLWQAVAGMHFAEIGAYAAQPGPGGSGGVGDQLDDPPSVVQHFFGWALFGSKLVTPVEASASALSAFRSFCARYHVTTVVADPTVGVFPGKLVAYVTAALGAPPDHLGGVDAWFGVAADLRSIGARAAS
jgi:hypothetical protein